MRWLRLASIVSCVLCVAVVWAAPGLGVSAEVAGSPDAQYPWAGRWTSSFGGFAFSVRTEQNGRDLLERIGGKACSGPTVYYAGGYNNPDDTGKIRGCTSGGKNHLVGRFESNRTKAQGSFDITRSGSGWKGTWSLDSGDGGKWNGDFNKHFDGDHPEPGVRFEYSMPQRYGVDKKPRDGLFDTFHNRARVAPKRWKVRFTIAGCDATASHTWTVDGQAVNSSRKGCVFTLRFPNEGQYRVRVESAGKKFEDDVVVQDWLIVGLGDSVASGEGNPDRPKPSYPNASRRWQSPRCDRSDNSFQARSALDIERRDTKTSVTFVHLACSGAGIVSGIKGPYWGIAPGGVREPLVSQVAALKKVVGNREIDAIMINAGANDLRFGGVLGFCVLHVNCMNDIFVRGDRMADIRTLRAWVKETGNKVLPGLFDKLATDLGSLVPESNRVLITQYPDELSGPKGLCKKLIQVGPLAITAPEVAWMSNGFLKPLNRLIGRMAKRHGWSLVRGQFLTFRKHGYCAGKKAWVVTLDQSKKQQGNANGTMHPNAKGHKALARLTTAVLEFRLYPGGKPRLPITP